MLFKENRGLEVKKADQERMLDILISQNFIEVKFYPLYSSSYVKAYLESPLGLYLIERKQLGSTIAMINIKDLKDIDIVNLSKKAQDEIMERYQNRENEIKEKINALQKQSIELQLKLYEQMNIKETIKIMEDK